MASQDNQNRPIGDVWLLLRVSFFSYLPALILLVLSFAVFKFTSNPQPAVSDLTLSSFILTKNEEKSLSQLKEKEISKKSLTEEEGKELEKLEIKEKFQKVIENQIKKSAEQELEKQSNLLKSTEKLRDEKEFDLVNGYIGGEIYRQSKKEAETAAKDAIEKLKADWKGDLFGQISFPVVFAIASIFAAFAVKDILTEILKTEDKDALKKEIKTTLAETFGLSGDCTERAEDPKPESLLLTMESNISSLIETNTTNMKKIKEELTNTNASSFKDIKIQLGWIEYELASLSLHKEESKIPDKELTEHKCRINAALASLLEIDEAGKNTIQGLKDCENMYFVLADGEDPSKLKCDNHNYKFEIMLARVNLVLNNINNPSQEVSEIITSLRTRIAERQARLSYHTEASDQINAGTSKYDRSE